MSYTYLSIQDDQSLMEYLGTRVLPRSSNVIIMFINGCFGPNPNITKTSNLIYCNRYPKPTVSKNCRIFLVTISSTLYEFKQN